MGKYGTPADVALSGNQADVVKLLAEATGSKEASRDDAIGKLVRTLNHPELCMIFFEFLEKSYSHENLSFWISIEEFREQYYDSDTEQNNQLAMALYNKYIKVNSPHQINLDGPLRQQVEDGLATISINTFDDCQKTILNLMAFDSYPKFLKSDMYKRYTEGKAVLTHHNGGLWEDLIAHFRRRRADPGRKTVATPIGARRIGTPMGREAEDAEPNPLANSIDSQPLSREPSPGHTSSSPQPPTVSFTPGSLSNMPTMSPARPPRKMTIGLAAHAHQVVDTQAPPTTVSSSIPVSIPTAIPCTNSQTPLLASSPGFVEGVVPPPEPTSIERSIERSPRDILSQRNRSSAPTVQGPRTTPAKGPATTGDIRPRLVTLVPPAHGTIVRGESSLFQALGRGIPVGYPWSEKMRQLVNGAEVTVADFSYTSLMQAPESIEILAQVIERSQSLLTLLLSGNGVTDAGATAILSALRSNKTVVHVDLSYNKLSAAVVEDIMFLLDHNESIERIYLQGNLPEGEGELITPAKEARVWARLSKNHMPDNEPTETTIAYTRSPSATIYTNTLSKPQLVLNTANVSIIQHLNATLSECSIDGLTGSLHELSTSSCGLSATAVSEFLAVFEGLPSHVNVLRHLFHCHSELKSYIYTAPCYMTLGEEIRRRILLKRSRAPKTSLLFMFTVSAIASICRQIASALLHYHANQVVLGFLSTDCIWFTTRNALDTSNVRVRVGAPLIRSHLQHAFAPELSGEETLRTLSSTPLVDSYSMGLILYELLSLKKYVQPYSTQLISTDSQGDDILPRVEPEISTFLKQNGYQFLLQLCLECLSQEPEKRPSMELILERLS